MPKKIATLIVSLLSIFGLAATPAMAWTYGLTGTGACQPDGSFKITWTIDNSSENQDLTVKASSNTAVVPANTTVTAGQTADFTETESGTSAPATYNLTLNVTWPGDQNDHIKSKDVILDQACTQPQNVTLCHATDSNTNPYERITIDANGAYNGHYTIHQGPVYPGSGGHWGDIIPPFTYNNQTYSLNWDTTGQAIYNAGCVGGGTGGGGGGGGTTTTISTTPQITAVPSGGVGAGEGGATHTNPIAVGGVLSSLAISAIGLGLKRKVFVG